MSFVQSQLNSNLITGSTILCKIPIVVSFFRQYQTVIRVLGLFYFNYNLPRWERELNNSIIKTPVAAQLEAKQVKFN